MKNHKTRMKNWGDLPLPDEKSPVKFGNFPLLLVLPARISVLFMGRSFWICEISHPKKEKRKKRVAFLAPGQQV
jgi:hypothetical protein